MSETVKKQDIACPLCRSSEYSIKYQPSCEIADPIKLYGAASGVLGTQTLVLCSNCGLLYENPRYPEAVILQGYRSVADDGHDSQHQMRVKSFLRTLHSLRRHLPASGAKVLDVGTGGGAFLDAAAEFGYQAEGIEPSEFLVHRGRQRGLRITAGTLVDHNFPPASFDLVSLWDVLEHVVNPIELLEQIKHLIKPEGVLLINYPDIGTWQAKVFGRRFWWLLSVHLTHFSPRTICKIAKFTGFEPLLFKAYWQTLELGYLLGIARKLGVPFSSIAEKLIPELLKQIPVPYYASQTTALLKVK